MKGREEPFQPPWQFGFLSSTRGGGSCFCFALDKILPGFALMVPKSEGCVDSWWMLLKPALMYSSDITLLTLKLINSHLILPFFLEWRFFSFFLFSCDVTWKNSDFWKKGVKISELTFFFFPLPSLFGKKGKDKEIKWKREILLFALLPSDEVQSRFPTLPIYFDLFPFWIDICNWFCDFVEMKIQNWGYNPPAINPPKQGKRGGKRGGERGGKRGKEGER